MKKTELVKESDNMIIVKTYSDKGYYVLQLETNTLYEEAVDLGKKVEDKYEPKNVHYIETNIKINED